MRAQMIDGVLKKLEESYVFPEMVKKKALQKNDDERAKAELRELVETLQKEIDESKKKSEARFVMIA